MENLSDERLLSELYSRGAAAKERGCDVSVFASNPVGNIIFVTGKKKIILARENWFYVDDMLNSFDFFFSIVVPDELDGYQVADFSQPGWKDTVDGGRFYFSTLPENDQSAFFEDYLKPKPGEIVLDLGAYCGRSATTFSKMVGPEGQVLSYEADPRNFEALQENVQLAEFSNVKPINKAVWSVPQSLWFSSEANMGSHVIQDPGDNRGSLVEVVGTTLQGILDDNGLTSFDVVKMDVEGAEYGILEASTELISRVRARWLIEAHPNWEGAPLDIGRIRRVMESCGYMTIQLQPPYPAGIYCEPRKR